MKKTLRDYLPILMMLLCAAGFGALLLTGVIDLNTVPQLVEHRPVLAVLVILALAAFGVAWYLTDGDLAALPQRLKTLRLPEWVTLWQAHEPKPGARLI